VVKLVNPDGRVRVVSTLLKRRSVFKLVRPLRKEKFVT
jgi:hypothetical protein